MSEENKPLDVFWFIPVSGDGADLGSNKGVRPVVFSYLKQIAANFWARIGRVRRASSSAMVGDPRTGAARRREYQALGIEAVIASGFPHPEEAYRVAELLLPQLWIGDANRFNHGATPAEFGAGAFKPAIVAE